MLKFLILGTLLVGLLALAANILTSTRRMQQTASPPARGAGGLPPLSVIPAPLAMKAAGATGGPQTAGRTKVRKTDEEWRASLTPEQYQVTRCSATERPFTGKYWDHDESGTYTCVACGQDLFLSGAKFDSGSGWPSYTRPATAGSVTEVKDISYGMVRTEIVCSRCESHLGHVFPDGPKPTGLRYCINSASLDFRPAGDARDTEDAPASVD